LPDCTDSRRASKDRIHRSAEVAQSAVMVLTSMGFEVGDYHPAAKLEIRRELADRIATSLE